MTANQTVMFTEAMLNRATAMGWNKSSKQITTFTNLVYPSTSSKAMAKLTRHC
jgi:hypothetical protein